MKKHIIFITLMLGCTPKPISPTPPVITDSEYCKSACLRLYELGCPEGNNVSVGIQCVADSDCNVGQQCEDRLCVVSCETFCIDSQRWGVWLNPTCVATLNSCDALESCALPGGQHE
jgi:hypothetical protein